jgi:hypothetical protein
MSQISPPAPQEMDREALVNIAETAEAGLAVDVQALHKHTAMSKAAQEDRPLVPSRVRIYSYQHEAYWRPNAGGYTREKEEAWVLSRAEAERITKHCGPEKRIELELVPSRWKSRAELETENERRANEARNWQSTAEQHCRNEQYYRGMLAQIGETLGQAVKTCDDGTTVPDVLVAKVVEVTLARISGLEAENARLRAAILAAPHGMLCQEYAHWENEKCDCWKQAALAGEDSNG